MNKRKSYGSKLYRNLSEDGADVERTRTLAHLLPSATSEAT